MDSVMHGRARARASSPSTLQYYAQKSDSKPVELGCFLSPVERGKGARASIALARSLFGIGLSRAVRCLQLVRIRNQFDPPTDKGPRPAV